MANNSTNIQLGPVRLTYLYAFKPNQNGKYGASLLIPKSDKPVIEKVKAAIDAAKKLGVAKWGDAFPAKPKVVLYDGDDYQPEGKPWPAECKGHYVLRATSSQQPGMVDRRCQTLTDSTQLYSGVWANVDINFYPYNNNSIGISCGLNNIQKVRDDEAFGGRARAQDVFSAVEDEDDGLGL